MKCQHNKCTLSAEYHLRGKKLCYEHAGQFLGYSPSIGEKTSELKKCLCCTLLTISKVKKSGKPLREIDTKKGDDAYWNWASAHSVNDNNGVMEEHIEANPDSLSEEDSLYHRPLSEQGKLQLEAIQKSGLTETQRRVLYLCGQRGLTQAQVAEELGITQAAVNGTLQRVRRIVQNTYKKIQR
jgi:DNA-directed RNA polymerase specialized sigma24 family protein